MLLLEWIRENNSFKDVHKKDLSEADIKENLLHLLREKQLETNIRNLDGKSFYGWTLFIRRTIKFQQNQNIWNN